MLAYSFAAIEGRKKDELSEKQEKSPVWIALDGLSDERVDDITKQLPGLHVGAAKLNDLLYAPDGLAVLRRLEEADVDGFADVKCADIEDTIKRTVARLIAARAKIMTVKAEVGVAGIKAAVEAATGPNGEVLIKIFVVGVLTNLKEEEVQRIYNGRTTAQQQRVFMEMARDAGAHGMICAVPDLPIAKEVFAGTDTMIASPGIRSADVAKNEQVRTGTPAGAREAGAHAIIMGRELVGPKVDTAQAVKRVHADIGFTP